MGLGLYLAKPIKFIGSKQSKVAEGTMVTIPVLSLRISIRMNKAQDLSKCLVPIPTTIVSS